MEHLDITNILDRQSYVDEITSILKMFEENNLSPNGGGTIGWDGTFNGQSLDSGVYTYYAQISFIDGKIIPYSGSITLVK